MEPWKQFIHLLRERGITHTQYTPHSHFTVYTQEKVDRNGEQCQQSFDICTGRQSTECLMLVTGSPGVSPRSCPWWWSSGRTGWRPALRMRVWAWRRPRPRWSRPPGCCFPPPPLPGWPSGGMWPGSLTTHRPGPRTSGGSHPDHSPPSPDNITSVQLWRLLRNWVILNYKRLCPSVCVSVCLSRNHFSCMFYLLKSVCELDVLPSKKCLWVGCFTFSKVSVSGL